MKTAVAITVSFTLVVGAMAASRLAAQTTGPSEFGVPPASTLQVPAAIPAPTPTTVVQAPAATPTPTPTTPPADASAGVPVPTALGSVQNIVEITRLVPAGSSGVNVFTVPTGVVLIVTDVVVTNTGATPTCGGAVNRSGTTTTTTTTPGTTTPPGTTMPPATTTPTTATATTPTTTGATTPVTSSSVTTTVAGTLTQTDSTTTGPLCVPAQTTTTLPLTTGIEFAAGQAVQLINAPDPAIPAGTTQGALGFHLRGLLVTVA